MANDYDAIVIGAGHNALVCAAYLAKAGYRVGVFERRSRVGGAVVTEEIVPGFRFDLGGSAHSFIHLTPIVRDLDLKHYGLDYIDIDPLFFMPFPDDSHLTMWRSVEQTCEEIARFSPIDAKNYQRLCNEWLPVGLALTDMMQTDPSPLQLGRALVRGLAKRPGWKLHHLPQLRLSLQQFLDAHFESEKVKALIGWLAAQSGLSPVNSGTAFLAVWHVLYHHCGISYPRGGSGELTQALARYIQDHGGSVHTNSGIERVNVENGQAVGVETADKTVITGKLIISGTHIKILAKLLGESLPTSMRRRIDYLKTTNGLGVALRLAVKDLPDYRAYPGAGGPQHRAIQLICPSMDYLDSAWNDYNQSRPSSDPVVAMTTFSAVDNTLSPAGKHVLSIWAQYFPYQLANGQDWESITESTANRILDVVAGYVPAIRENILDMVVQTPVSFEKELGLIGGDIQHLRLTPDQMFMLRPGWQLSHYSTPIKGLYLTGSSTHPGGGIMGMAGLNTAGAVLKAKA